MIKDMTMSMLLCLRIRSRPVKSMYSYLLFSRNMIQIKDVKVKSRKTGRTSQIATLRHNLQQVRAPRKKAIISSELTLHTNFQMFLQTHTQVTCTVLHFKHLIACIKIIMGNHKFLDFNIHQLKRWPKHTKILAQTSTKWLLTIDKYGTTNWSNQTPKTTMIIQNS